MSITDVTTDVTSDVTTFVRGLVSELIESVLEPVVLGLDEAGAGPGFGSLWASAVYIPKSINIENLKDSKKLSARKRTIVKNKITENCYYGMGEITSQEIDQHGMGWARYTVFHRALDDFSQKYPSIKISDLIIDGDRFQQWNDVPFTCVEKADTFVPQVSAASILAKTSRDSQVLDLCDHHPELDVQYKLRKNKGYLTAEHVEGIRKHGRSRFHRTSFKIRALGETP